MSRRAAAVITTGAGALFVVLGSLFELFGRETVIRYGPGGPLPFPERRSVALTGWELVEEPVRAGVDAGPGIPVYGYGLVFAAVLAGVGAVLQLRSPLLAAIGRFAVLVASGVVVGTVWAALETLRTLFGAENTPPTVDVDQFVGTGTWLLSAAAVALLVGAVLAHDWPERVARPTGPSVYQVADDEDDTPPFGIAIPVADLGVPADPPPGAGEPGAGDRRHPTGGNSSTLE
ncbi:hypothetical protein [Saccharothrix sp. HUAS TT1]|uniref:hypothetical protein n=1 Tax=unclassified Saccharothrix TaxID=2593673 RepID=UPI00345BEDB4